MNTEFKVGHYYRLRKDYPKVSQGATTSFEGRVTIWSESKSRFFDGCARQVTYTKKLTLTDNRYDTEFDGISGGRWYYHPKDFEEVAQTVVQEQSFETNVSNEEKQMELKNINKKNLEEASEQFEEERTNAEVEFAKKTLREASDKLDTLDRDIKHLEEAKKPHLEVLQTFGIKRK